MLGRADSGGMVAGFRRAHRLQSAITAPMLKKLPHVVAALAGVAASLALVWLPLGFGVLAGGVLGMAAGRGDRDLDGSSAGTEAAQ